MHKRDDTHHFYFFFRKFWKHINCLLFLGKKSHPLRHPSDCHFYFLGYNIVILSMSRQNIQREICRDICICNYICVKWANNILGIFLTTKWQKLTSLLKISELVIGSHIKFIKDGLLGSCHLMSKQRGFHFIYTGRQILIWVQRLYQNVPVTERYSVIFEIIITFWKGNLMRKRENEWVTTPSISNNYKWIKGLRSTQVPTRPQLYCTRLC